MRLGAKHEAIDFEDLMAPAPAPLRAMPGSCLDVVRGVLFERPTPEAAARVGSMRPSHARWVATAAILIHPTHGGRPGGLSALLAALERVAAGLGDAAFSDAAAIERVLRDALAGTLTGGVPDLETVCRYLELRELLTAWRDWLPPDPEGEDGRFLLSLVPADVPDDLRRAAWEERERISVAALQARAISAGEVARRAAARLVCVDVRLRQWERLSTVIDTQVRSIEADLEAGRPVAFPIRVSDTYRVVRPDGSVAGQLRQTVRVEIVTEDMLWLDAARGSGWSLQVESYLSGAAKSSSPARVAAARGARNGAPVGDGQYHSPGGGRRLFVVYAGTSPARHPDDEHHPPHLVELYGCSALIDSSNLSPELRRIRREVVERLGLQAHPTPMMGLTWWPGRTSQALPHLVLRHVGRIVLPYRQLRLTLAYGCAVARLELMSGLRIGESMQSREGGCFSEVDLPGRTVATMRGRPKGWRRDRLWVVDWTTMALLRRIKGWVVDNWYQAAGALPFVEYGEPKKNSDEVQCAPARYLFQMGGRAALTWELNQCLRIATLGLPHATAHDYRYAFGKLLKVRGATGRARARALSHVAGSAMVERYGDWDCQGLEDGDDVVAEHQERLDREVLGTLIDAG